MRPSDVFLAVFRFLIPPALIGTVYLYFYPVILQCDFPLAKPGEAACYADGRPGVPGEVAPFRLLALADPQLEGDTSLPDPDAPLFPSLERLWQDGLKSAVEGVVVKDVPRLLQSYRKRLDLWGNDLYLAHIFRSVRWWTQPTHMVVLGDLLGSQWIDDAEFTRRRHRFWDTVFKGSEKVSRHITELSGYTEPLDQNLDVKRRWGNRIIAVAGNHDIGYAGDIDEHRIERFEDTFGSVNWEITFRIVDHEADYTRIGHAPLPGLAPGVGEPELRLVILNSMNLDEPALKPELRQQSLDFLDVTLPTTGTQPSTNKATILLTHIPLHKEAGTCVDAPLFTYFAPHHGGGIKEQNHLSPEISKRILDGLTPGKSIVLNGHDHEGCDTYHHRAHAPPPDDAEVASEWQATHYFRSASHRANASLTGLREITVRSMMGSYSGNAGLLSAWWDDNAMEWKFEYATCVAGVQHIWWLVHVLDIIVLGLGIAGLGSAIWEAKSDQTRDGRKVKKA